MGRAPTRNQHLPTGMRARHRGKKIYYFLDSGDRPRKETPLGQDYTIAVQKWAELSLSKDKKGLITFRKAAERYLKDKFPGKSAATQKDNLRELANLYKMFDDPPMPLDDIEPQHIRRYMDWRVTHSAEMRAAKDAKRTLKGLPPIKGAAGKGEVRANREKALFSHIFNFAREKGMTNKANPCAGVSGYEEDGRDIYIDDAVFSAVWECGEPHLRDAMDLAYLTAQRPADVRKMSQADIKSGSISIRQNKGGHLLRVVVEGEFSDVLERIAARTVTGMTLAAKADGKRLTQAMLRGAFDRARIAAREKYPELAKAIQAFQFRDLRAKAGTDTEESRGMGAAKDQLGHTTETMTAHYVRHRLGKLVKPTK